MYSGVTKLTVREAIQPVGLHRILASSRVTSSTINSPIYDTKPFKEVFVMTDISQISGTNTGIFIQPKTSPDNSNWYNLGLLTSQNAVGNYYQIVSGYVSEYTKFEYSVNTSGGCWCQIDANFVR